ncbi:hypothetical protein ACFQ21_04635 [Ohtaekwangia kribbensis]|jgi:hypothetical protein|uniref:Uncharacterized protein n=1 Tax=Ohtaekwangia kribbensis TaxID=688913 RepID=A0ABW3K0N4_9BACT
MNKKAFYDSLLASFLYVGLGTISVMSIYPGSLFHGGWAFVGVLLTLPVSFVGFGIMYADSDGYWYTLLAQVCVFFVAWFVTYQYYEKKYRNDDFD